MNVKNVLILIYWKIINVLLNVHHITIMIQLQNSVKNAIFNVQNARIILNNVYLVSKENIYKDLTANLIATITLKMLIMFVNYVRL